MACKTFACLWTMWAVVTFHLFFPMTLGIDCYTGTTSVLFNYCGAASDLLGRSILCMRDAVSCLLCIVLERVKSAFVVMLLGFVMKTSLSVCFQLTRPLQEEQNDKCFWRWKNGALFLFFFFWCGIVSEVGPGCSPKDSVSAGSNDEFNLLIFQKSPPSCPQ